MTTFRTRLTTLGAACALVVSACGGSTATIEPAQSGEAAPTETVVASTEAPAVTAAPTTSASPATTEAPAADPALDLDRLSDDLSNAAQAWIDDNGAPGVSLSLRLPDGETINVGAGVTDLQTGDAVAPDDYFRIASITKPMTSVMVLQLVEEGLVELDEPVATYLGDDWLGAHPGGPVITVRQLLNHTNGLIEFAFDIGFYIEAAARPTTPFEPEEIIDFLGRQDPLFAPGEAYQYETGGFVAAGLIVEAITGNSAAAEMRARVFEPAGAVEIYLTPEEFPPEEVAHGYVRGELYDALTLLPTVTDNLELTVNDEPVLDVLDGPQEVLQSAGWTGGGNEAQLSEVSAIFAAMFNGTLLNISSVDEMVTKTLDVNYGLGIDNGEVDGTVVYSHGGGVPGFRSQAGYLPEFDVAYAFSSTLIPLPDGKGVSNLQQAIVAIVKDALDA